MQWLAEICIQRPVFTTMLIVAIAVFGLVGYGTLGVDRFPNVDFPVVTVVITNPGASAVEIERDITEKVESAVNAISGVKEIRSTSVEGISQVNIQFSLNKDFDVAAQEVRDKVNLVIPELPKTIEPPTVQKFETNASPVIRLAVSAPYSLVETTSLARRQVKDNWKPSMASGGWHCSVGCSPKCVSHLIRCVCALTRHRPQRRRRRL